MNCDIKKTVCGLLQEVRYQFPTYATTWSSCHNNCGNSARGGRLCVNCLTKPLSDIIGFELASQFVNSQRAYHDLMTNIDDMIAELEEEIK